MGKLNEILAKSSEGDKEKEPKSNPQDGWGSKIGDYGNYQYDDYYDGNGFNGDETFDEDFDGDLVKIMPNFWTEGDGFGQTVFIGTNTFWGIMMLSVFFGMISCAVLCAYLNFKRLFLNDKLNWKAMDMCRYQADGLRTIDECGKGQVNMKDPGADWSSDVAEEDQLVK